MSDNSNISKILVREAILFILTILLFKNHFRLKISVELDITKSAQAPRAPFSIANFDMQYQYL